MQFSVIWGILVNFYVCVLISAVCILQTVHGYYVAPILCAYAKNLHNVLPLLYGLVVLCSLVLYPSVLRQVSECLAVGLFRRFLWKKKIEFYSGNSYFWVKYIYMRTIYIYVEQRYNSVFYHHIWYKRRTNSHRHTLTHIYIIGKSLCISQLLHKDSGIEK